MTGRLALSQDERMNLQSSHASTRTTKTLVYIRKSTAKVAKEIHKAIVSVT